MTEEQTISSIRTLDEAIALIRVMLNRISELESEVVLLRQENVRLKEEVAVLKKDSSTSSKPPSSDITSAAEKNKSKRKRKRGGQKGRKASFRALLPKEEVDEFVELSVPETDCPDCGSNFSESTEPKVLVQQTAELPQRPIHITEYTRAGKWCESCQQWHYAALPDGVIEGQFFGPRLQSLIGYMKGNLGASYTELSQFCQDVLKVEVSRGMLCKVVERVSKAIKPPYEQLKESVPKQEKLNIDETGWKDSGNKLWAWIFCNDIIAFFVIASSRATQVLRDVLGESFDGAITSDFYSAYICFANKQQQFCLAHLIRDVKFLTTLPDPASKEFGTQLLKYFRKFFKLWHSRAEYPPGEMQKKADRLKRKMYTYLIDTKLPKGKAATLKKRIITRWEGLFKFFDNPALYQPTNNNAEQTLRHLVRIRRHTQGSKSPMGQLWNARIMTVLETCRKQNRSPWEFILQAVHASHFGSPAPSLVPS